MVSKYFREQCRYTQAELLDAFQCREDNALAIIKRLKEYNVLKVVKANASQKELSELDVDDIAVADVSAGDNEYYYVFTFVGVITISGIILKIYPKYLLSGKNKLEELKIAIKVLEKYNSKAEIVRMVNGTQDDSSFNLLAVMLYLIRDYYENGSYMNSQEIIESNGAGEILWDKTINETFTLISNNRPFYVDLLTKRRVNNDFDYFKRLHECILTQCSKELESLEITELFDITPVDLSDETIEDFGDKDYILYRLQSEINVQFNTRKQLLLKTLYAYIDQDMKLEFSECFSMFGTNSFNLVWEDVCANIMNNQLDVPLGELKLPKPLCPDYSARQTMIEYIEKPRWKGVQDGQPFVKVAEKTLIPDLIAIFVEEEKYTFFIFDAKYYNLQMDANKPLRGQPGIESITKQYLYQLAYKNLVEDHGIQNVRNSFLLPTEGDEIIFKGYASMKMLEELGLQPIEIWMLPAHKAFEYYLQGRKISIKHLAIG